MPKGYFPDTGGFPHDGVSQPTGQPAPDRTPSRVLGRAGSSPALGSGGLHGAVTDIGMLCALPEGLGARLRIGIPPRGRVLLGTHPRSGVLLVGSAQVLDGLLDALGGIEEQ